MKVYYINILLFSFPLSILVYNQRNHKNITLRTPKTEPTITHRTLCECDLYKPDYDNDPEMKEVMEIFNIQMSERVREYDERMIKNRQQCKEQCEKDIQKIILKDKLEKQIAEQFSALETNIDTNDIPTCVFEKSMADKLEKTCLKCGRNLGVAVPGLGVLGAYGTHSMVQVAIAEATNEAMVRATDAGIQVGMQATIQGLEGVHGLGNLIDGNWNLIVNIDNFNKAMDLIHAVQNINNTMCNGVLKDTQLFCSAVKLKPSTFFSGTAEAASDGAEAATLETAKLFPLYKTEEILKVTNPTVILSNPVVIAFVAIIIIVIILLIMYLILRYRRKKKMKKKLQYIKLLNE
ncbi:rifin [Plasmodium sp. gorilla clade G1]|nr:rifin [Plasmodium sp. gorilla clade G1]